MGLSAYSESWRWKMMTRAIKTTRAEPHTMPPSDAAVKARGKQISVAAGHRRLA